MSVQANQSELTLGPVLFNWQPERWRDFYFRIADEAPVTAVYLGEVICFKRAPLFDDYRDAVAARLAAAGKTVVRSTLAEVMSKQERQLVEDVCAEATAPVEANDGSALLRLRGRPHHVGPFINVYNERTLAVLAGNGACNVCLPPEMPASAIRCARRESRKARRLDRGASIRPYWIGTCPPAAITRARTAAARTAASSSATSIPTAWRCARWRTNHS